MDLTLSLICDDARERPDGRIDVVGAYDELTAPGFPAVQSRMTVVFVMEWADDETGVQSFRADLVDGTGERILTIEGETQVAPRAPGQARRRTRLIQPLQQIIFPRAGQYRFELLAGGDLHGACSLFVSEQPDASPPTNGSQRV